MEMEHINENTMRVFINQNDLEERGITMLDLIGNQNKIEDFFHQILEEVDKDQKFRDTDTVTFQVVPTTQGLELYITKDVDAWMKSLTREHFNQMFEADDYGDEDFEDYKEIDLTEDSSKELTREIVAVFPDFEDLIDLSLYFEEEEGVSFLHVLDDRYYLTLVHFMDESNESDFLRDKALVLEYGEKAPYKFDYLEEYGRLLFDGQALSTIAHYFQQ